MGTINLSNSKGRDAVVGTMAVRRVKKVRYLDAQQRQAQSTQILKSTIDRDIDPRNRKPATIANLHLRRDRDVGDEAVVTGKAKTSPLR